MPPIPIPSRSNPPSLALPRLFSVRRLDGGGRAPHRPDRLEPAALLLEEAVEAALVHRLVTALAPRGERVDLRLVGAADGMARFAEGGAALLCAGNASAAVTRAATSARTASASGAPRSLCCMIFKRPLRVPNASMVVLGFFAAFVLGFFLVPAFATRAF